MISRDSAKVLACAALLSSGPAGGAPTVEVKGECSAVFKGQVCTWARTQGSNLVEVGASVAMATIEGECSAVFKGQVCTWARTQGSNLVEVGASVGMATIEGAPSEPDMTWPRPPRD